jgi:hypothetical protein
MSVTLLVSVSNFQSNILNFDGRSTANVSFKFHFGSNFSGRGLILKNYRDFSLCCDSIQTAPEAH